MYIRPQRIYRNIETGKTSPLIYEVISDQVTLRKRFTCGLKQGTWFDTPFLEVDNVSPLRTVPDEIRDFSAPDDPLSFDEAVPLLFGAICDSIEKSWCPDKIHIVYHSSGWDSRIISAAIKYLIDKNGYSWLGNEDLIFLANRWEAIGAEQIIRSQNFGPDCLWYFASYRSGPDNEHFDAALDFRRFYKTCNAPIPIPGNLWYYLPEWCQFEDYDNIQGYAGLWANETWRHILSGGIGKWLERFCAQYYYNVLAVLPSKIKLMEYPLSDLKVLAIVDRIKTDYLNGDDLREAVAQHACYQANGVPNLSLDDRGHPLSRRLQTQCKQQYDKSWYAKNINKNWQCPKDSEFSSQWGVWGLASLCEQLIMDGVKIRHE